MTQDQDQRSGFPGGLAVAGAEKDQKHISEFLKRGTGEVV